MTTQNNFLGINMASATLEESLATMPALSTLHFGGLAADAEGDMPAWWSALAEGLRSRNAKRRGKQEDEEEDKDEEEEAEAEEDAEEEEEEAGK